MDKVPVNLDELKTILSKEKEQPKQVEPQPRKAFDCFDCPYLTNTGRAYYCMFFKVMKCPKGYGVPSIWEFYKTGRPPKETRAEEASVAIVIRPPFPDPIPLVQKKESDNMALTRLYHREIYEWHYEQGKSFAKIAKHLGCSAGYISSYMSTCNKYWGWSWDNPDFDKDKK